MSDVADFTSDFKALVLQDEAGKWAEFEDGKFSTDDKAVADRLRKVEYVTEVKPSK